MNDDLYSNLFLNFTAQLKTAKIGKQGDESYHSADKAARHFGKSE
jgi:hypothetical protein